MGEIPLKCDCCGGRLISTKKVEWVHNQERVVYRCNKCGKNFVRWQDSFIEIKIGVIKMSPKIDKIHKDLRGNATIIFVDEQAKLESDIAGDPELGEDMNKLRSMIGALKIESGVSPYKLQSEIQCSPGQFIIPEARYNPPITIYPNSDMIDAFSHAMFSEAIDEKFKYINRFDGNRYLEYIFPPFERNLLSTRCPYANPIFDEDKSCFYCEKHINQVRKNEAMLMIVPWSFHVDYEPRKDVFGCTKNLQYNDRYLECPLYKEAIFPIEGKVSDYYSLEKLRDEGEDIHNEWTTTIAGIPMVWRTKYKKIGELLL